ncbi:MAG TPA: dienelactone hydrolase family protein [Polyangiaceae bacterium]
MISTGAVAKLMAGFVIAGTIAFGGCGPVNPQGVGGASGTGGGGNSAPEIPVPGPHAYNRYTGGWRDSPAYSNASIFFPTDLPGPLAGVAVVPGFTETQLVYWGELLASHGYITITIDTNDLSVPPEQRAEALKAAIQTLKEEGARAGSPIYGRMGDAFAVMGHSMGGGASLIVGNENPPGIKASIALTPWRLGPDFPATRVPSLLIGAENDLLVAVSEVQRFYNSIPASTPKTWISFTGATHSFANHPVLAGNPQIAGRYALAWLAIHVRGDASYKPVIQNNPAFHIFQSTLQ